MADLYNFKNIHNKPQPLISDKYGMFVANQ